MKFYSQITILLLAISIFSCKKEDLCQIEPAAGAIKIMPLGDSRVEGASPEFESYRYELWKMLVNENWNVDFVGTRTDNSEYAAVQGKCFDNEHEGTGGAVTADILKTVEKMTAENIPDVVLLGIGGNDLTEGGLTPTQAVENINQIIDLLQSKNENITIFLEQIAPGRPDFMTAELTTGFIEFNSQISSVVGTQTDETSQVIVLDMASASSWSDDFFADEVHYNAAGAKVVAERYFDGIEMYLER